MKSFQKLFTTCALSSLLLLGTNCASALTLSDVSNDYWAASAIVDSVQHGYLTLKGDKFAPNDFVTRAEFANAVYNVIQRAPISGSDGFNDVSYQTKYGRSILTLQDLQIVCGYPNGDFKPDANLKRSEASSIIANVVRTDFWDIKIRTMFQLGQHRHISTILLTE